MAVARKPSASATPSARGNGHDFIPFPIYVVDTRTLELVSVNQAMQHKTGAQPGQICHKAIYGEDKPCIFCKIGALEEQAVDGNAATIFEHFNDSDDCWYQLNEALVDWFDGRRVKHSIAVDIGALKEAQNELTDAYAQLALKSVELEKASITDALTGLFNRRRLDEAFAHELDRAERYGKPLSLMITDVDHFKAVNDTYGHQMGDEVLQMVAGLLRNGVRAVDVVGRWGGEEFLVLCPDTDLDGARALADKLRAAVADAVFPTAGGVTSSFGVACHRRGESFKDTVARADKALYYAKSKGRNRVEG